MDTVWVFQGPRGRFPSGFFSQRKLAEEWIRKNRLTGMLTAYPIDQGLYDWEIEYGHFRPKREDQKTPDFIENFDSGAKGHFHYEDGELTS